MRRVNNLPWLAVGLSRFLQITTAQVDPNDPDHGVRWAYPPRSEEFTFHYMDTVEVEWTSFFDEPILYTFCMSDDDIIMEKTVDYVEAFNGSKTMILDWTDDGPPCWFNLRPNTSTGYGSNSNSWGYEFSQRSHVTLGADISSTTTSITTSEPTSSPTSSTTTTTSSVSLSPASTDVTDTATSDSSSSSSSSSSSTGLSVGAQAGIGVAAGIVGIGFGVLGAILWMRKRNKPNTVGDSAYTGLPAQGYDGYSGYSGYKGYSSGGPTPPPGSEYYAPPMQMPEYSEMQNTALQPELDTHRPPAELPTMHYGR